MSLPAPGFVTRCSAGDNENEFFAEFAVDDLDAPPATDVAPPAVEAAAETHPTGAMTTSEGMQWARSGLSLSACPVCTLSQAMAASSARPAYNWRPGPWQPATRQCKTSRCPGDTAIRVDAGDETPQQGGCGTPAKVADRPVDVPADQTSVSLAVQPCFLSVSSHSPSSPG